MLRDLAHIGIVVTDLEEAINRYANLFGFALLDREIVETQGMEIAIVGLGTLHIELMQPTSDMSVLSKFLQKRGPGIHHLAYLVDDIRQALKKISDTGIRLIDREPRPGSGNTLIAFVHPKDTDGVLIELCEKQKI